MTQQEFEIRTGMTVTAEIFNEIHEDYKFYLCETCAEASELNATLVGLGNPASVDFSQSLGWFVRVKKVS